MKPQVGQRWKLFQAPNNNLIAEVLSFNGYDEYELLTIQLLSGFKILVII